MLIEYTAFLFKKIRLNKNTFLFSFQIKPPQKISFQPGQYLILKIKEISRLYSISSTSFQKNSFDLIIELVSGGLGSNYLSNLKIGEEVKFQGPAGFFFLKESNFNKLFFATGTGIAPFRSMIFSYFQKNKIAENKFFLFWGLKKFEDVYLLDEWLRLKEERSAFFDFLICLSQEKNLQKIPFKIRDYFILGHVNDVFEKKIPHYNYQNFEYYLCGSREAVESLKEFLLEKRIPQGQIFFEKY